MLLETSTFYETTADTEASATADAMLDTLYTMGESVCTAARCIHAGLSGHAVPIGQSAEELNVT